jgi:hypothetical protein
VKSLGSAKISLDAEMHQFNISPRCVKLNCQVTRNMINIFKQTIYLWKALIKSYKPYSLTFLIGLMVMEKKTFEKEVFIFAKNERKVMPDRLKS